MPPIAIAALVSAALAVGGAFGWHFGGLSGEKQVAELQAQYANEREKAKDAAVEMTRHLQRAASKAAQESADRIAALDDQISELKRRNSRAKPSPIPEHCRADCRLSDERLRLIREAVSAANGRPAASPGASEPPMPESAQSVPF